MSVAALFAPLGSDTVDATVALLEIVPLTPGVTSIVAVATAAAASEPRSHRTSRKGKLTTVQEPWLEVAELTVEISERHPVKEAHARRRHRARCSSR